MNKNKNKIIYIVIIILLIALATCISIKMFKKENTKKHSDDIDVINIDCNDENCEEDTKNKDNSKEKNTDKKGDDSSNSGSGSSNGNGSGSGSGNGNGSGSGSGTSDSGESGTSDSGSSDTPAEDLIVGDKEHVWSRNTNLKIFDVESIAPGYHGTYDFALNNNTSKNVNYSITFNEDNQYNANMMYKLKRNNKYIAGDTDSWVYYNKLNFSDKILNSKDEDIYTLEWKWVSTDNDTPAGRGTDAHYKINISVEAVETAATDPEGSGGLNPFTGDNIIYYIELLIISALAILLLVSKRKNSEENEDKENI